MINQMERRFRIIAISVISTVLLVLIILVNGISINTNTRRADFSLDKLAEEPINDDKRDPQVEVGMPDMEQPEPVDNASYDISEYLVDRRDKIKEENRSFIVYVDSELNFINSSASFKNMMDDDVSFDLALSALEKNSEYGFVDEFRYLVVEQNNQYKIIFLDYSFERQAEVNFIMVSIGAYIAAVVLVYVLVIIFLKPVMKPIRESYAKQKQFITDASHELKTPLTIISTDMELLEMENGHSEWIDSVNNQVKRMNALTNELVTLSRMNEESSGLAMSDLNLSDIVNDVIMGFEPAIEAKGKSFHVNIEDDIVIKGNHDSLERVMSILMNNALKYSNEQGDIKVGLTRKGKKIKLKIANSVDEIEVGNHEEYFRRFFRSDASRNSENGGFGIGLAVARTTIEEHKGKITANSPDGKSLEITITLKI